MYNHKFYYLNIIFVALLFAACVPNHIELSESVKAQSKSHGQEATEKTQETEEEVTLRWFMRWDQTRVDNVAVPVIEAFEAEHPHIKVRLENVNSSKEYYQRLQIMLAGDAAPDVFYPATHIANTFAAQGLLHSLDELIDTDALDLARYEQSVLALYQRENQTHCLPVDMASLVVFYNKEMFDRAGISYPQAPWTWEEFLETANLMTGDIDDDRVIDQFGSEQFYNYWPLLIWTETGHNVFDDMRNPTQFLLEEPESIEAIQWLADLSNVYGVVPTEEQRDDIKDMFEAGKAAMHITGHWRVPRYLDRADFDFDFVALPSGKYSANRADGSCFAIARNSQHPKAAWEFVKFLAGPDSLGVNLLLELQQMVPAVTDLQQSDAFLAPAVLPNSNKTAFLAGQENLFSLYDPIHPIYAQWEEIWKDELGDVWSGDYTAAEAVEQMGEEIGEILEELAKAPDGDDNDEPDNGGTDPVPPPKGKPDPSKPDPDDVLGGRPNVGLPTHYYVSPNGDDANSGTTLSAPLKTIQRALFMARPGDTIHLAPGDYLESVITLRDGLRSAPITVVGSPDAILRGTDDHSSAFRVSNDYYTLVGFTIDGLRGDPEQKESYTEKLIYAQGREVRNGVTGLRILNMSFRNAGGECVRLRYFAQEIEIAYSTFHTCGLRDYRFDEGGKNGEAIYIGTSTSQWDDGKNPTSEPDRSTNNWIHHNYMNTQGNECVDIKEGSTHNIVEYNECTGQLDPDSGGLGARGDENIFRYNTVYGNLGAGIRLGGHKVNGVEYGKNNQVYGNKLYANVSGGVKIETKTQGKICGNLLAGNLDDDAVGSYGDKFEPGTPCEP